MESTEQSTEFKLNEIELSDEMMKRILHEDLRTMILVETTPSGKQIPYVTIPWNDSHHQKHITSKGKCLALNPLVIPETNNVTFHLNESKSTLSSDIVNNEVEMNDVLNEMKRIDPLKITNSGAIEHNTERHKTNKRKKKCRKAMDHDNEKSTISLTKENVNLDINDLLNAQQEILNQENDMIIKLKERKKILDDIISERRESNEPLDLSGLANSDLFGIDNFLTQMESLVDNICTFDETLHAINSLSFSSLNNTMNVE